MLGVHTEKGRDNENKNTKRCQRLLMQYVHRMDPRLKWEGFADPEHSADGLIYSVRGGRAKNFWLVEIKSRNLTEEQFSGFGNTWLITDNKVRANIALAQDLGVPWFGALNMIGGKVVWLKQICDENGVEIDGIERRMSRTQATINGGTAVRLNAYIPMDGAERLPYDGR